MMVWAKAAILENVPVLVLSQVFCLVGMCNCEGGYVAVLEILWKGRLRSRCHKYRFAVVNLCLDIERRQRVFEVLVQAYAGECYLLIVESRM
jgi:hypothetical protein